MAGYLFCKNDVLLQKAFSRNSGGEGARPEAGCQGLEVALQQTGETGAVTRFAAALPFDLMHAFATMLFLGVLYVPWTRRIDRIVRKYDLRERG